MVITTHLLVIILAAIVSGGLAVNIVGQLIKKFFGLESDGVIHTLILTLAGLASVAQYIIGLKAQLPPEVLGITGTSIYGFSQAVFKYAQIASRFMAEVREYNASADNNAAADDAQVSAVNAPAALTEPAPVSQVDF